MGAAALPAQSPSSSSAAQRELEHDVVVATRLVSTLSIRVADHMDRAPMEKGMWTAIGALRSPGCDIPEVDHHADVTMAPGSSITMRALHLIEQDYRNLLSVRDVAKRLGVHPVYLARCFSRSTSRSVSAYLRAFKVGVAIVHLVATDDKAAAIAASAGFGGRTSLFRAIAQMTDRSPGAWRAERRSPVGR